MMLDVIRAPRPSEGASIADGSGAGAITVQQRLVELALELLIAVPDGRFAAPVAATAYSMVTEGRTNATRYAAARRAHVEARQLDGALAVSSPAGGRTVLRLEIPCAS